MLYLTEMGAGILIVFCILLGISALMQPAKRMHRFKGTIHQSSSEKRSSFESSS